MFKNVWPDLFDSCMGFDKQRLHLIKMPDMEILVTRQELLALQLVVLPEPVIPDVILRQAYINVVRCVLLSAL